ncbi:serine hydrolase domain-containing protein [Kitasatospora sp. NPDC056327]|uniref:serine hydrolase domain-containing protein n=1 Tax=Kitasatospora sp. NPDC056327 TaxID=3345785 RepID=UPI0035DF22A2
MQNDRQGWADEGFGAVADAFARNFADFPELGSAVTVHAGGRKVVELWGGTADERTGRPWEADTLVPVFSCAKAVVSVCAHLLAQRGRLDLDAPVARYWPGFARNGKQAVTTRMVLAHRAGVPALDAVLTFDEVAAWTPVVRAIEEQRPLWEPDTAHEYHGHVFGFAVGEVIRRITGLTPGTWFRETLAGPLGLDVRLGLPAAELPRLARLAEAGGRRPMPGPEHLLTRIVTMNGALVFPGLDEPHGWNDPALHAVELPGAGAVASATGLSALFAAAVTGVTTPDGGHRDALLTPATVADATREISSGPGFLGFDAGARWGSGFLLPSPAFRPMLGPRSFGNDGAGGQFAFADPDFGVAFAYTANRMIGHGDPRADLLVDAVRTSLGG